MSHPAAAEAVQICAQMDASLLRLARLMSEFNRERGYERDGCPNTVAWLKLHGRLSAGLAVEVMAVARQLPRLPEVEQAAVSGSIGFEHAAAIADAADKVGAEALFSRQAELVEQAERVDPGLFRQTVRKVEHQVDAELMRRESERAFRSRYLDVTAKSDGRVKVEGLLDPVGGALLRTALDAAMGPRLNDETRSERQRRADGLTDVARHCLDGRPLGDSGCRRPHVSAWIDEQGQAGIDGLGAVGRETIERLLCDCALSVNGSPEARTFSAAKRTALARRVRSCQFPGCDRPANWTEGHHLDPYSHGGKTVVDRGALLCGWHHRLVHEGGWSIERQEGELVALRPDGSRYRSGPAPPTAVGR